jgi:ribonucleotide monophosphatase NagD (HAD superfamily)
MSTALPTRPPERLGYTALIERYDAILFDAYGVLVNASGALPGAAEAVARLVARQQTFLVVTNDASRSPERAAARFASLGIPVRPEHVLSSGMLMAPALQEHGMQGKRVVVLGTGDSANYARQIGAQPERTAPPISSTIYAEPCGICTAPVLSGRRVARALRSGQRVFHHAAAGESTHAQPRTRVCAL